MRFYYDSIYWIILIPVLLLSLYAQIKVISHFHRMSPQVVPRGHPPSAVRLELSNHQALPVPPRSTDPSTSTPPCSPGRCPPWTSPGPPGNWSIRCGV